MCPESPEERVIEAIFPLRAARFADQRQGVLTYSPATRHAYGLRAQPGAGRPSPGVLVEVMA